MSKSTVLLSASHVASSHRGVDFDTEWLAFLSNLSSLIRTTVQVEGCNPLLFVVRC